MSQEKPSAALEMCNRNVHMHLNAHHAAPSESRWHRYILFQCSANWTALSVKPCYSKTVANHLETIKRQNTMLTVSACSVRERNHGKRDTLTQDQMKEETGDSKMSQAQQELTWTQAVQLKDFVLSQKCDPPKNAPFFFVLFVLAKPLRWWTVAKQFRSSF